MLVVISDLHLTDGSSGATISAGAFEIFAERLRELAIAAGKRADGSYRPIERLDLLLLGDVLDVIRSSRWVQHPTVRPWSPTDNTQFSGLVTDITNEILRRNDASFAILRGMARQQTLTVPPAGSGGRMYLGEDEQPVDVKIHYMVGNHDWFFHLPGHDYDLLRQMVGRHMGLANRFDRPFAHDPAEDGDLLDVMRRHRVFARHGDVFDPFNFEGDRDGSSLGDAIVVELLNRFATQVELELGDDLPVATAMGLREIDNVRPLVLVPVWIDGLLERTCAFPSMRKQVKLIWDKLADEFLQLPFVQSRDTWYPTDLVDGLQKLLKFSKRLPLGWASQLVAWLHGMRGGAEESYFRNALGEQDFRNRRAKHIVYGHTHHVESIPLDASYAEGYVLNQNYFNSGTWRRVHRQTELAPTEHEFIAADVMTYLAFFHGDERSGRPYETWSGTLGLAPVDSPIHRIDMGKAGHARADVIQTPVLHRHAPHFTPGAAKPGVVPTRRVS